MEQKTNWTDLRKQISKRAGVTEAEAGTFLNTLVQEIIAGLKSEKQVKINGLGTFKLQAVANRKSVNVTTGEAIIIPGYNKLNFNAEAAMKERIERSFNVVPTNNNQSNPLQKLSAQADEIVDILADLGQAPQGPKIEEVQESATTKVTTPVDTVKDNVTDGSTTNGETESSVEKMPFIPDVINQVEDSNHKKHFHPLRDGLITIGVLVLILIGGYFFLTNQIISFADGLLEKLHSDSTYKEITTQSDTICFTECVKDTLNVPTTETKNESLNNRVYEQFIDDVVIRPGQTLAQLARKYYGRSNSALWVFIYEANQSSIQQAGTITIGTHIRIPQLEEQYLQTDKSAEILELLEQLQQQYDK